MSVKFKTIIMSVLVAMVGVMFSGCDTWSYNSNTTPPPITTGTVVTDKDNDPNFDKSDEDLTKDTQLDESAIYDFLDGVKFAYNGTQHKLDVLADPMFEATLSKVDEYLQTHNTIDCQAFADTNSELQVDATSVSRTVWIYNYINQYKALAKIILTKLAENYGYGIGSNYSVNNNLYGSLNFAQADVSLNADYSGNKNTINCGVYETAPTFVTANPYQGQGDAVYDKDGIYVNFNTETELTFDLGVDVPSKAYKFELNLATDSAQFVITAPNPYYDPDNIVNKPTIQDPEDDTQTIPNPDYIEGHILGKSTLSFVGAVADDDSVNYSLGSATITEPSANDFASAYAENYADYLGLRLLEAHLNPSTVFGGAVENVYYNDYTDLYEAWTNQVNKFGFDENAVDAEGNEFSLYTALLDAVYHYVVGTSALDADENAGAYSRDLYNMVAQIVHDSLNAKTTQNGDGTFDFDYENGTPYFVTVYNIEYKDYTAEELFGSQMKTDEEDDEQAQETADEESDDLVFFAEEEIYSFVVMLKEEYEPVVMQSMLMLMLAPNSTLNVDIAFRYVKGGKEIINSRVDYSLQPEQDEDDEGYVVTNSFDGRLAKYDGQELSMEFADECMFAIEDYNTPDADKVKNKEILIETFKNYLPSAYFGALNVSNGNLKYAYDAGKDTYYYNETASDCDFVEINFSSIVANDETADTPADATISTLKHISLAFYVLYFDTLSNLQATE